MPGLLKCVSELFSSMRSSVMLKCMALVAVVDSTYCELVFVVGGGGGGKLGGGGENGGDELCGEMLAWIGTTSSNDVIILPICSFSVSEAVKKKSAKRKFP